MQVSPYIASSKRPPPRYEHSVALVGSQMYLIGGNCGEREEGRSCVRVMGVALCSQPCSRPEGAGRAAPVLSMSRLTGVSCK